MVFFRKAVAGFVTFAYLFSITIDVFAVNLNDDNFDEIIEKELNEELDFDHTNFLENIHLELDLNLNLNISTQNNEEHNDNLLNDELMYSDHDNFYDFFIDILNDDNDITQKDNVDEYDHVEIDSMFTLTEKELNFCNAEFVDLIKLDNQKHINKHIFEYLNFILPITFDSYLSVKKALFYLEQHAPYLWLDLKNFAEQFDSENIIDHMYFLNTLYLKILPQMALKERKDVEIVMGNLQGISPIAYALLVNISKYPQSINNNTEEVLKENYPTFYEHYQQSNFNEQSVQSKVKDRSVLGKRRPLNQEDQPVLKKKRILKEDVKNLKEEILNFIKDKSILEDLEDQENFIEELMITLNYTKYAGLRSMLIALYENEVLDQNIKDKLKKLSNAAKRMYNKKGIDNNYNKLDPQKVIEAIRIIFSTSVIDTALDLENVVKKLKIDLNYENTYSAFRTVLVNVSQKEELSEEEKDILRRLSNAAVRIYNRQIIVNQLTSNQQKTLEVIRMVLSASITDTEADWENAVEKLKTDLEHKVTYKVTYAVLNMMFGRLSQKNGLSDGEKDKIRKLGDAIKRLCGKQKSQLNLLKNKPVSISMVEDVTPIRAVKKRNRKDSDIVLNKNGSKAQKKTSDKVLDKDVGSTLVNNNENAKNLKEEILNVIKDKVMSGDFKDQENFVQELMTTLNYTKCAGLRSIFVALYKEEAVNQNIKDKLKILSNAAERIYRKQRMANKLTSAQQKMLEVIRTFLLAPMTDAEIDWESLVEKFKIDLGYTNSYAGLSTALLVLSQKEELSEGEKDKVRKLSNAADRIYKKQSLDHKLTTAQQKMLEVIRTFLSASMLGAEIDWESLVEKLKIDLGYTNSYVGLSAALLALSKKEELSEEEKDKVRKLSNAAERIYTKQNVDYKLTSPQQKMLEAVRTFLSVSMTGSEIDWESLVKKLKENLMYKSGYIKLSKMLGTLSQKNGLSDDEKDKLRKLGDAAGRIDQKQKADKRAADELTLDQQKILGFIDKILSEAFVITQDDWRNVVKKLKADLEYTGNYAELREDLLNLSKKKIDKFQRARLKNISDAALRMHKSFS